MGREVRKVPPDWEHPKEKDGRYRPLLSGESYRADAAAFAALVTSVGREEAIEEYGFEPDARDYMLADVPEEQCTHYMMYEDTSEGTPISPAFATKEELCRWLVDNKVSIFGSDPADYETWMRVANGGIVLYVTGAALNGPQVYGGHPDEGRK